MTKDDMVRELSEKMEMTQVDTRKLFDVFFEELSDLLSSGENINFQGFGTFSVAERDEHKGFNPLIEKWMMLPKKIVAKFKPSNILKDKVNGNG